MRVALYARYSTELQSEASIADQFRPCLEHAEREGWDVVARFQDAAISGGSMFRPGIQDLIRFGKLVDRDMHVGVNAAPTHTYRRKH